MEDENYINEAQNVYASETLVRIQRTEGDSTRQSLPEDNSSSNNGNSLASCVEPDEGDTRHATNEGVSRSTQTYICSVIWAGKPNDVIIAEHYISVSYGINTETVEKLQQDNFSLESIHAALGQCLVNLEWSGEEILEHSLTAFKMKMKDEKLSQLLSSVVNIITDNTKVSKIVQLVQQAFHNAGVEIVNMKLSSLTFLFHHNSEAGAKWMLRSEEAQGNLIGILYQFLPAWVRLYAAWEITPYSETDYRSSMCPTSQHMVINIPLLNSPYYEDTWTRDMTDMSSLVENVQKSVQQFTHKLDTMAQFLESVNMEGQQKYGRQGGQAEGEDKEQPAEQVMISHLVKDTYLQSDESNMEESNEKSSRFLYHIDQKGNEGNQSMWKHEDHTRIELDLLKTDRRETAFQGGVYSFHVQASSSGPKLPSQSYHQKSEATPSKTILHEFESDEPRAQGNAAYKSGAIPKTSARPPARKPRVSKTFQAEKLLNWVNVKSKASQSMDPEIQRLMEQVEHSLQDEEKESPRAQVLDTVLLLDTSDSVALNHLDELKAAVHGFVDRIEEIMEHSNIEENLAIVQMGGRAWVRQHLTNDFNLVRDVIDCITPDSEGMPTGGRTPLFQALLVCLGAVDGKGGVALFSGCHRVQPRLIIFTDGLATDEASEFGADAQSNTSSVRTDLIRLINEFAGKTGQGVPFPMFWVPIGDTADRAFLKAIAKLSHGKMVEKEDVGQLSKYNQEQQVIGSVYSMIRKHKDQYCTEEEIRPIIDALAVNLGEENKEYILQQVLIKQKGSDEERDRANDFDYVYEDKDLVKEGRLPALGTRVKRGRDWKWENQDTEGLGTVLQHKKSKKCLIYVMWDNGTHNVYRYGHEDCFDIETTDAGPRILGADELIEIGVAVTRGPDWSFGDEDGCDTGVVIRKRRDGQVRVRWNNGYVGKYRYGADGQMELQVVEQFGTQE